jgi:hypothetical protein
MKITAVNISKTFASGLTALNASEKAWKLNEHKLKKDLPKYVIGVASGKVLGYFTLKKVSPDGSSKRVKFLLKKCSTKDTVIIDAFIKGKNLKYFVIKNNW